MVSFFVKLLRVPPLDKLSGVDVFELMVNGRHVAGQYWIFEGDVESLSVRIQKVAAEGVSEGFGDMSNDALVDHCEEIFGIDLSEEHPSWKMLTNVGR